VTGEGDPPTWGVSAHGPHLTGACVGSWTSQDGGDEVWNRPAAAAGDPAPGPRADGGA
jgi:hypothetical protein